jgi:hypothetical protein
MDIVTILRVIANSAAGSVLTINQALDLALDLSGPDFATHDGLVAYIDGNRFIKDEIEAGRYINAIKQVRQDAHDAGTPVSLTEAKAAVDAFRY